jgi:hypothetical protein
MRAVTEEDAKAAAAQRQQDRAKRTQEYIKIAQGAGLLAIIAETVVLQALGIAVCIKVIRR